MTASTTTKTKIAAIYRKHNPSKLHDLDDLMIRYAGREEELLSAVQSKYGAADLSWPTKDYQWSFVLKRFPTKAASNTKDKHQKATWCVEEGLKNVETVLEERAESIGGECLFDLSKAGDRVLVVRRKPDKELCGKGLVTSTVEAMRELVHKRHQYKGRPTDVQDEHERRKMEKERDQARKDSRGNKGRRASEAKAWNKSRK